MSEENQESIIPPDEGSASRNLKAVLNVFGAAPFIGGVFSAIASEWSDRDQERYNKFILQWIQMLEDELKEKEKTIGEIIVRLDPLDEKVKDRIESDSYQRLLKKAFRQWSNIESDQKRTFVRNILTNAASTILTSDEVISLFLDWINNYSETHFKMISAINNDPGIKRSELWKEIGMPPSRENTTEVDLFKLLIRDLITGGIIQEFAKGAKVIKSGEKEFVVGEKYRADPWLAEYKSDPRKSPHDFDDVERFELSKLGSKFVYYSVTDLPIRIGKMD